MKATYSILERQQHIVRHLQDSLLKAEMTNICKDLSDDLLKAIEGLRLCTGHEMHNNVTKEITLLEEK